MRYTLILLIAAGCASSPQMKAEQAIARQAPYCDKLGYTRNTDGWRRCIEERERARNASSTMCTPAFGSVICS